MAVESTAGMRYDHANIVTPAIMRIAVSFMTGLSVASTTSYLLGSVPEDTRRMTDPYSQVVRYLSNLLVDIFLRQYRGTWDKSQRNRR